MSWQIQLDCIHCSFREIKGLQVSDHCIKLNDLCTEATCPLHVPPKPDCDDCIHNNDDEWCYDCIHAPCNDDWFDDGKEECEPTEVPK